jgi:tetratricopeptide (TPR) repeat protein
LRKRNKLMKTPKSNLLDKKIKELKSSISSKTKLNCKGEEKNIAELLQTNQIEDAERVISSLKLTENICDKAVIVYVQRNKIEMAKNVIKWAKGNSDKLYIWRLCIYEFARTRWRVTWGYDPEGVVVMPGVVSPEQRKVIQEILDVIQPVLLHIEGDQSVSNDMEAKILYIAVNSFWILGDIERVRKLGGYLATKQPASIELANLAMMGVVDVGSLTGDFPYRLKKEHPNSLDAKILAELLRARLFGQPEQAYDSLMSLSPEVSDGYKLKYCNGLFKVAQLLNDDKVQESLQIVKELLGEENSFYILSLAECAINSGQIDEAEEIVENNKYEDDPQWLQISAFIQNQKGHYDKAIEYYEKASRLIVSPEIHASLGMMAAQAAEKDSKYLVNAVGAFKKLLEIKPDDLPARHNLSIALARSGEFQEAKEHFKYLVDHTDDFIYKQNYANCLVRSGESEDALKVYDEICELDGVSVECVLAKTDILKKEENPFVAFDFLHAYRDRFWDKPTYVQVYLQVSSQANHDELMVEALNQLRKLKDEGVVSPDVLQEKTIEDILEHSKSWNERTKQIQEMSLKGRLLWPMADEMLNHTLYMGWAIRTQEMSWISEDPTVTATYSVYTTNSFHPLRSDDDTVQLQRPQYPAGSTDVVMDITAAITLQRLGIMDKVKLCFGNIHIPSRYIWKLLKDNDRLLPHQYSNYKSLSEIKRKVDDASIKVLDDFGTIGNRPYPYINEHTVDKNELEHYYRIADLLSVLEKNGLVRQNELAQIRKIVLKPSGVDSSHREICKDDEVVIELSTLKTLFNFDLLDEVCQAFKVAITPEAKKELFVSCNSYETQDNLRGWNLELIDLMRSDDFMKVDVSVQNEEEDDISLLALSLSTDKRIPLMADERVVLASILNEKAGISGFSTDVLVDALYREGKIEVQELTDIYLKLIGWRYKFLVPPVDMLNYLAEQYLSSPPGKELEVIAMYMHGCMRDPGLFCGFEKKANIPLPIAAKLYMEWQNLATDFMISCALNPKLDKPKADRFIHWAIATLVPSPPKYLADAGQRLANLEKRTVLSYAITQLMSKGDIENGNKVLLLLKEKMGLSDIEYNKIVSETFDAI